MVRELAADGVPVATACRALEVSTSGYYEWNSRPASDRAWEQAHLMHAIATRTPASYGTHGHRRIHAELVLGQRLQVSHGRVERLMRSTWTPRTGCYACWPAVARNAPATSLPSSGQLLQPSRA